MTMKKMRKSAMMTRMIRSSSKIASMVRNNEMKSPALMKAKQRRKKKWIRSISRKSTNSL